MYTFPLKSRIIKPKENLEKVILEALRKNKQRLREGDVLVISSKVVSVTENRIIDLKTVKPSKKAIKLNYSRYGFGKQDPRITELAFRESENIIPGNMPLTLSRGMLVPMAGIDLSNMPDGYAVLWPKNSWDTAINIKKKFRKTFNIKKIGVIIADSWCQPLRYGTTGLTLGYSGFFGVEDCRGKKDIFKKPMLVSQKNVADNLVSTAQLLMGETDEQIPFVIIRKAPVKFSSKIFGPKNISMPPKDCLFSGLYPKKWL